MKVCMTVYHQVYLTCSIVLLLCLISTQYNGIFNLALPGRHFIRGHGQDRGEKSVECPRSNAKSGCRQKQQALQINKFQDNSSKTNTAERRYLHSRTLQQEKTENISLQTEFPGTLALENFVLLRGIRLNTHHVATRANFYEIQPLRVTNMEYSFLHQPTQRCTDETHVVIVSPSPPHHAISRQITRDTWASVTHTHRWPGHNQTLPEIKVFFILGQNSSNTSVVQSLIKTEQQRYGDLIISDFEDSYFNLTLKSLMMLQWVSSQCPQSKYIVKCDEDIFLHIPQLLQTLYKYEDTPNLMVGSYNGHSKVHRGGDRWDLQQDQYPMEYFPPYLAGPAYILSKDLPPRLVRLAPYVFPVHLEDVYVTGVLARVLAVRHVSLEYNAGHGFIESACNVLQFEKSIIKVTRDEDKVRLWEGFLHLKRDRDGGCLQEGPRLVPRARTSTVWPGNTDS